MAQSVINNSTMSLLEKAAAFGQRRHEVLAGNIANINTPRYRMRDLSVSDFQQALKQAVAELQSKHSSSPAGGGMSGPTEVEEFFPRRLYEVIQPSDGNLTFQDANDRSIERQVMELTKNTMMQNFAIEMLRFQMESLQAVISERP